MTGRAFMVAVLAFAGACAGPVPAPSPPVRAQRIASLDYCADQFVLKLAAPERIIAVSPDADEDFSYMREAGARAPQARPTAEAILALKPDLVVRSYGGGPGIEARLAAAGIPTLQIGYAETLADVQASIRTLAQGLGEIQRGEALIAEMDARLAALPGPDDARPRALYATPAGVTTGQGSLIDAMIAAAGLANFETAPGWRPLPLERLAGERPDLVAAAFYGSSAAGADQWSPARHPIMRTLISDGPTVALNGAWTACGGWFIVDAVEALAAAGAPP